MTEAQEATHPTREEVWRNRSAHSAFPVAQLSGCRTAASFFSAAFYGRNDVTYLDHVGVRDIVLVDLMADHLASMAVMYPGVTQTYCEDAFAVARRLLEEGRQFDVVVTDPFTGLTWDVLTEHFETFAGLTKRLWVIGVTTEDLDRLGVEPNVGAIQVWLDKNQTAGKFEASWFKVRNRDNGASWLGIRRAHHRWWQWRR